MKFNEFDLLNLPELLLNVERPEPFVRPFPLVKPLPFVNPNDNCLLDIEDLLVSKKIDSQLGQRSQPTPVKRSKMSPKKALQKKPVEQYYSVRSGDTLYSIGRRYRMSINELYKLNPSIKGKDIYPGQKLRIK